MIILAGDILANAGMLLRAQHLSTFQCVTFTAVLVLVAVAAVVGWWGGGMVGWWGAGGGDGGGFGGGRGAVVGLVVVAEMVVQALQWLWLCMVMTI